MSGNSWDKQFLEGVAAIRRECAEGASFQVHVLPAKVVLFGSKLDPRVKAAIADWLTDIQAPTQDGRRPACVTCGKDLGKGQVSGFIVVLPVGGPDTRMGMTGVLCRKCHDLDDKVLADDIMKAISETYRTEVARVH